MKKLLLPLFIFIIANSIGFSQSLSLSDSTGPIVNNGTITIVASNSSKLIAHVDVTNNSASTIKVICKKEHINIIQGTDNSFCWGGACLPPTSFVSGPYPISSGTTVNGGIGDGFEGDYLPKGNPGTSTIKYTFFNESDTSDAVSVIVQYTATVGIDELLAQIDFSEAYPNPASNQVNFNYSLPAGVMDARLIIYDVLGNRVKENIIYNMEGRMVINTETLTSGLYFYSLIINDRVTLSRKLIKQ